MSERPSRLGRGLAALIGDMAGSDGVRVADIGGEKRLPVDFITPNPRNPRRDFDPVQLEDLATSIREKGLVQPILVRPTDDPNRFEIIAGERRWRAAQRAGLHEVPVIVREVSDRESLELAIIENVQRADLNPLEEAEGYGQLMNQFGYTQLDLSQVIGKSRPHVANTLRLLKLPEDVKSMLTRGELSAGHARTLVRADDPVALARRIVADALSVREAEALIENGGARPLRRPPAPPANKDADILAVERQLSEILGLKVVLHHRGERGRLEIRYSTLDQLDSICARLTGVPGH